MLFEINKRSTLNLIQSVDHKSILSLAVVGELSGPHLFNNVNSGKQLYKLFPFRVLHEISYFPPGCDVKNL